MTGEQMLQHVAGLIAERGKAYGDAATSMAAVAAHWSITLGHPVTPAQVVLCLIDLKLTRLNHNPKHRDLVCDLAGYAAILQEVNGQRLTSPAQEFARRLRDRLFGSTRQPREAERG